MYNLFIFSVRFFIETFVFVIIHVLKMMHVAKFPSQTLANVVVSVLRLT